MWEDSKVCSQCKQEKPMTEYNALNKAKGKFSSECKECHKKYETVYYHKNHKEILDRVKNRYYQDEKIKEKKRLSSVGISHSHKFICRQQTRNAVMAGKLIKQPCSVCGENEVEAHHNDYTKPLEIDWFCRKHHRELHRTRDLEEAINSYIRKVV